MKCRLNEFIYVFLNKIQLAWKWNDQQVNPNISLAQFDFLVRRDESYKTDYYVLQYPGVILEVI